MDNDIIHRIVEESNIIAAIKTELNLVYGLELEIDKHGHVSIGIMKGPRMKYGESPLKTLRLVQAAEGATYWAEGDD